MAKKKAEDGAPMWVVTYGDMMSLLLCFFIMLAALANFDNPNPKLAAALESIREALGMTGQSGKLADPSWDFQSMLRKLETIVKTHRLKHLGQADAKGVEGKQFTIRQIRDGAEITLGGPITFSRSSAELQPAAEALVEQLAGTLAGHLNKIEVRGHATPEPLPPDSPYRDPMDLSVARARSVADVLIAGGINPRTIRIVGVGSNEPVVRQAYVQDRMAANRRVEVVVRESVISEFEGEPISAEVFESTPTSTP
ncbi:MAG: OmpA family protein [Phycisphaerae bacterium]|nr:OmpA family protein [Phycisphaerae bacterium]